LIATAVATGEVVGLMEVATVVVGGPLAAVATVAVGISSSVKTTVIVAEASRLFTD